MKICYFGTFERTSLRSRIIQSGLEQNGARVIQCWVPYTWSLRVYAGLLIRWLFHTEKDIDGILVGEGGYVLLPLAKLIGVLWGKPVVLDGFCSVYQTLVFDRKLVKPDSFAAKKFYFWDKVGCLLADAVVLDTEEHIKYFKQEFGLGKKQFLKISVGADDSVFYPRKNGQAENGFTVLFWGTFIPLHGVEYILKAAKILEEEKGIRFVLIGAGQTYGDAVALAKELRLRNVELLPFIDEAALADKISEADVCLGIFGATAKAKNVIPCKVYQALAMAKPVITGRSHASEEMLKDKETAVLCEFASGDALARSILLLRADTGLRARIAANGHQLFISSYTPDKVVLPLMEQFKAKGDLAGKVGRS